MQFIRCTHKLLRELKIKPAATAEAEAGCLGGWHANLILIERKKCVLFTSDTTLYSIFVPGLKKRDFESFSEVFRYNLISSLKNDGFSAMEIEKALREYQDIEFAITDSRSVLGSMNDLVLHLKYWIDSEGGLKLVNLDDLNKRLNRIIMGAIKYANGIEMLKIKLAEHD